MEPKHGAICESLSKGPTRCTRPSMPTDSNPHSAGSAGLRRRTCLRLIPDTSIRRAPRGRFGSPLCFQAEISHPLQRVSQCLLAHIIANKDVRMHPTCCGCDCCPQPVSRRSSPIQSLTQVRTGAKGQCIMRYCPATTATTRSSHAEHFCKDVRRLKRGRTEPSDLPLEELSVTLTRLFPTACSSPSPAVHHGEMQLLECRRHSERNLIVVPLLLPAFCAASLWIGPAGNRDMRVEDKKNPYTR